MIITKLMAAMALILSFGQTSKAMEGDIEEDFRRCVFEQAEICQVSANTRNEFTDCMSKGSIHSRFPFDGKFTATCGLHYPPNYLRRCTQDAHLVQEERPWATVDPKDYDEGLRKNKANVLKQLFVSVSAQGIVCAVGKDDEAGMERCVRKGSASLIVPFDGSKPTVSCNLHYPHAYWERNTGELTIFMMATQELWPQKNLQTFTTGFPKRFL